MNCEQVHDLLGPFLDRELPQDVADAVDAHIGNCALCHQEATSLQRVSGFLQRVGPAEPPGDLFDRVLETATCNRPASRRRGLPLLRVAAALLGALGVGFAWSHVLPESCGVNAEPRPLAGVLGASSSADGITADFDRLRQRPEGRLLTWALSQGRER